MCQRQLEADKLAAVNPGCAVVSIQSPSRVCQYLPRSMNVRSVTLDDMRQVEQLLKEGPRKTFGWSIPAVKFTDSWQHDHQQLLRRLHEPRTAFWARMHRRRDVHTLCPPTAT